MLHDMIGAEGRDAHQGFATGYVGDLATYPGRFISSIQTVRPKQLRKRSNRKVPTGCTHHSEVGKHLRLLVQGIGNGQLRASQSAPGFRAGRSSPDSFSTMLPTYSRELTPRDHTRTRFAKLSAIQTPTRDSGPVTCTFEPRVWGSTRVSEGGLEPPRPCGH